MCEKQKDPALKMDFREFNKPKVFDKVVYKG